MAFELGRVVGDYEFVDILRSSKNLVSYKVKNVLVQRYEVLKIIPGDLHQDPERLERFQREIKIHARLDHPNILAFYNATVLDGHLVMTTAFVEGTTVEERLEVGRFPWKEAVNYASQALSALGLAHAQGIVHRELTPGNLLISSDGELKLMGFGQAKATQDPRLTQKGAMVGSLYYMSPEQVRGVEQLDGRSDLYSLGAVLFEMVTGQRLFKAKSHFDIMLAHVNTVPPRPSDLVPEVPQELSDVILRCLDKDPDHRYSSAMELRAALRTVAGDVSGIHTRFAPPPVERPAQPAPPLPSAPEVAQALEAAAGKMPRVEVKLAGPSAASGPVRRAEAVAAQESVAADAEAKPDGPQPAFSKGEQKAFLVLACTVVFLLITAAMFAKLG